MEEGFVSDQLPDADLKLMKERFFVYIDNNIDAIDRSLPVFFSHVVSAIEAGPIRLPDPDFNFFLDEIACRVFRMSRHEPEPAYNKLLGEVLAEHKRNGGRGGLDLVSGLHAIGREEYQNAVVFLKKYRTTDPLIGSALAFCYIELDRRQHRGDEQRERDHSPSEMLLSARQQLISIADHRPPLTAHPLLDEDEEALLASLFWDVYAQARQWFPHEAWFPEIALALAKRDADSLHYALVLEDALSAFPDDIRFLRRAFSKALAEESIESAATILRRMVKLVPDGMEPVYYGFKLAVITGKRQVLYRFRKLAIIRGIPPYLIHLLEYAFELLRMNHEEVIRSRERFLALYPKLGYIMELLSYLEADAFSGDPSRQKRSMQAIIPVIDRFAMNVLKIGEE